MRQNENLSTIRKGVDRATGIVLHDNQLLVMHRRNRGKEYYTFPGGGIEKGETPEDALRREFMEETSIEIEPKKLLYTIKWDGETTEAIYLCSFVIGSPKLAEDAIEREVMLKDSQQYYQPLWVPITKISSLLLYPLEVRDWFLEDLVSGFADSTRSATLKRSTARQSFT